MNPATVGLEPPTASTMVSQLGYDASVLEAALAITCRGRRRQDLG